MLKPIGFFYLYPSHVALPASHCHIQLSLCIKCFKPSPAFRTPSAL